MPFVVDRVDEAVNQRVRAGTFCDDVEATPPALAADEYKGAGFRRVFADAYRRVLPVDLHVVGKFVGSHRVKPAPRLPLEPLYPAEFDRQRPAQTGVFLLHNV